MSLIFILGGARSGKSGYALELARQQAGDRPVLFVATAQAGDDEMSERIARHQRERPADWQTLEAPDKVGATLTAYLADATVIQPGAVIIDCLTLLVSNLFFASADAESEPEAQIEARVDAEVAALIGAAQAAVQPVLIVSNEVGLGIVPLGRISRVYRDLVGRANRRLAAAAPQAIFVVAGIPLDLKQLVQLGGSKTVNQ